MPPASRRGTSRASSTRRISRADGRHWIDTTIRGQADRGTGLLNNTLHVGQLSWNRCSYIKDPQTGRRVARVNKNTEWEVVAVPELRIIEQELWDQVKARQAAGNFEIKKSEPANALNGAHRQRFLLSGVLTCGCCGGGYTIIAQDRYGGATRRGKGTCDNARSISRQHIEARVLGSLREHMLTPALAEEFGRAFEQELAELQRDAGSERLRASKELDGVCRRLEGVLRAIENGAWNDTLKARLTELERSKAKLADQLARLDTPAPPRLHPNAAAIYRDKIATLEASLNAPDISTEAMSILRQLIAKVVLTPDAEAPDGLQAELHGDGDDSGFVPAGAGAQSVWSWSVLAFDKSGCGDRIWPTVDSSSSELLTADNWTWPSSLPSKQRAPTIAPLPQRIGRKPPLLRRLGPARVGRMGAEDKLQNYQGYTITAQSFTAKFAMRGGTSSKPIGITSAAT